MIQVPGFDSYKLTTGRETLAYVFQLDFCEGVEQNPIIVFAEGVEILPHGATEQNRILRNDGDFRTQIRQSDHTHIHVIDKQGTYVWENEIEANETKKTK